MLKALQPGLLVVAAYGQILSKEVLTVPSMGGINVHASLLPKYRGAAPIAWAIANGEKQSGVTIIRMSASLDAGDMLDQRALDILPDETAGELEARLAPLGASLAMQTIQRMKAGPISGIKQDKALVTKAPKLKKEDGLINWTLTAEQVCWRIRAMQPWPTAYTFLHLRPEEGGRGHQPPIRIIVTKARVSARVTPGQPSGVLLMDVASGDAMQVVCGDGSVVEILELQPAGKKRMPTIDFRRGNPLISGDRVGAEQLA